MKLNIASGPNIFPSPGWVNIDRVSVEPYLNFVRSTTPGPEWPEHQRNLANWAKTNPIDFRVHDIRQGLPFPDACATHIYLGQFVEHVNPIYELPAMLKECYRLLAPRGVMRITTPDLDLLIDAYRSGRMAQFTPEFPEWFRNAHPSAQLAYIMYGACGPKCTIENYEGHMFLFTKASMTAALVAAGFTRGEPRYRFGLNPGSDDPVFAVEAVDAGLSHSFVCEVVK